MRSSARRPRGRRRPPRPPLRRRLPHAALAPRRAAGRAPPTPVWRVSLDRLALGHGSATFDDEMVSPATVLTVSDLTVTAKKLLWPTVRGAPPGTLEVTASLPGGGLFLVEGTASLDPLDMTFQVSTLDVPIEPYQAYFPFPARFKGLFSGDSLNTIKTENGKFLAASQGNAFAKQIEVSEPGAASPAMTLEKMEIRGIDFSWPNYAFVGLAQPAAARGPAGAGHRPDAQPPANVPAFRQGEGGGSEGRETR